MSFISNLDPTLSKTYTKLSIIIASLPSDLSDSEDEPEDVDVMALKRRELLNHEAYGLDHPDLPNEGNEGLMGGAK